ncbi:MAG: hypothetical protein GY866_39090, partial [Proteobacteria bacterium]|nr:hypothetical protein [Pseudomonadota bacterium]
MTKDAILVPTGEIHKLADALFTLVSYQLKVDRESKAEVFFADGQVAISIHDLSRQIKEHFVSAKIEESEIVLDESGSIPIQESRSGLNLFQLLMLAAAPLSNSSDETLRREVLIVFEHLETLVRTLNRLIRFDCHDRVSWVKSRHNETNCFYLRVIDMPLFELLRLQDENDLGDPAEPTVALYRKLFAGGR